jgi:ergot alkaloid biosynthesis protein
MSPHPNAAIRILVTGATGNTGRPIATQLTASGFTVRTAARRSDDPGLGAEHVPFDWTDRSTHDDALSGVHRMYLLAPGPVANPESIMVPFIERALARGVRRVVLLSSSAVPEGSPGLGLVHQFLRERAPEWSVLQPSWFMQNFVDERHHHGGSVERDGRIVTATGDGRVGFVDANDIAAVATRALAEEASFNAALLITGPEALSYDDVADAISRVRGRRVQHVRVTTEEVVRHMTASGIPEAYARLLAQLEERIRRGEEARVTDTVQRITGRAPRAFEAFLRG